MIHVWDEISSNHNSIAWRSAQKLAMDPTKKPHQSGSGSAPDILIPSTLSDDFFFNTP